MSQPLKFTQTHLITCILLFLLLPTKWVAAQRFENITGAASELLKHTCRPLINRPLEPLCSGIYKRDSYLKYHDQRVQVDSPYKVFGYRDYNGIYHVLVSFYKSPLHMCKDVLRLSHDLNFYCGHSSMPLEMPGSDLHCQMYSVSYVDELVYQCTEPTMDSMYAITGTTAVHYSRIIIPTDAGCAWLAKGLVLLLSQLMLLLLK